MSIPETVKTLNDLCKRVESLCELAETAQRNKKSLSGRGHYASRFHKDAIVIGKLEATAKSRLTALDLDSDLLTSFCSALIAVQRTDLQLKARIERCRDFRALCQTKIIPAVEASEISHVPASEQVLPMDVVRNTRGYLVHIIQQANGCYEKRWFDACGVMMRKFVEILIIHAFEAEKIADRIKRTDGNFHMLAELIDRFLAETTWNPGRETRSCLPEVKLLGDRSAHNRTFMARKPDVDKALFGFRITAEELLHLAKLR
jgi:hypothetical protein